ncbi:MAG: response regulator [Deltaproteobacteria bacterium]|nr:response regulator [Deltaproteobacteria bacterium]
MSGQEAKFRVLRSRAETLMVQSKGVPTDLDYKDVQALVHDLSVHQIQLEMQNDELQQAQLEMQQVRDEYLKLYNHAPTGYISLDEYGIILKHNQTFAAMLGDVGIVAVGMSLGSFMFPDDRDILQGRFKAFFKSPQGKSITARLRRSDGSLSWTQLSGRRDTCLTGSHMVKEVLLLTLSDINKEKLAEEKLLLARDTADAANRVKSEFLATMSHEIRTPMNGILGMVQLLNLTELTEEQQEYLAILKTSGDNLLTLINNILDLSKIEAGRIELERAEFSLRSLLNDLVRSQQQNIESKGLAHRIVIGGDVPEFMFGDQLRLKQILLNLLGNALKFTENGSITVSVAVVEQRKSNLLLDITMEDTGIGMAADILEHIFMPFTQGDGSTTRRYGGTGLGLTISRRLAELMDGSIQVESCEGRGSTFHLLIPFTAADSKEYENCSTETGPGLWDGPFLSVLFVEDDEINTKFGVALLKKMGHMVTCAKNGKEALNALETGRFDLILMDVQMPVMNGDEALAIIREGEKDSGIRQRVIALTAFALKGNREKFIQQGFDGYHSKPIDVDSLVSEMKRVTRTGLSESKGAY